ncbi:hypothetical protein PUN28_012651 [Cardiocondyla obscurior]|uniref:Uncharacterized protein n=1 Tax=Cardiocondyla obscurior TaxID=286306 RepID=A0AAW2FGY9_9HYME
MVRSFSQVWLGVFHHGNKTVFVYKKKLKPGNVKKWSLMSGWCSRCFRRFQRRSVGYWRASESRESDSAWPGEPSDGSSSRRASRRTASRRYASGCARSRCTCP